MFWSKNAINLVDVLETPGNDNANYITNILRTKAKEIFKQSRK